MSDATVLITGRSRFAVLIALCWVMILAADFPSEAMAVGSAESLAASFLAWLWSASWCSIAALRWRDQTRSGRVFARLSWFALAGLGVGVGVQYYALVGWLNMDLSQLRSGWAILGGVGQLATFVGFLFAPIGGMGLLVASFWGAGKNTDGLE